MPATRRPAWQTTSMALLALQLALAAPVALAQEVDASAPTPTPLDSTAPPSALTEPAQPVSPDVVPEAVEPMPSASDGVEPASASAGAEPAPARSRAAPYALWGTSVVSLALGTVFGVMALGAKQDYDDAPSHDRANRVHNLGIAADTGLGLGLLLAITGTVFYFVNDESVGANRGPSADASSRGRAVATVASSLRIAPLVSHHAHGGTLALRF